MCVYFKHGNYNRRLRLQKTFSRTYTDFLSGLTSLINRFPVSRTRWMREKKNKIRINCVLWGGEARAALLALLWWLFFDLIFIHFYPSTKEEGKEREGGLNFMVVVVFWICKLSFAVIFSCRPSATICSEEDRKKYRARHLISHLFV